MPCKVPQMIYIRIGRGQPMPVEKYINFKLIKESAIGSLYEGKFEASASKEKDSSRKP